jgi:hypothetical protein
MVHFVFDCGAAGYDDDDSSCGEYDDDGNYLGGTLRSAILGAELASGTYYAKSCGYGTSDDGNVVLTVSDTQAVSGCTDAMANNYDENANVDDGTCDYSCLQNGITVTQTDSYGDGWNGDLSITFTSSDGIWSVSLDGPQGADDGCNGGNVACSTSGS